jgi:hypothetical protein
MKVFVGILIFLGLLVLTFTILPMYRFLIRCCAKGIKSCKSCNQRLMAKFKSKSEKSQGNKASGIGTNQNQVGTLRTLPDHSDSTHISHNDQSSDISINVSGIADLKNAMKAQSEDLKCCICMTREKTVSFVPCEHICACDICALKIIKMNRLCPLCRTHIMNIKEACI